MNKGQRIDQIKLALDMEFLDEYVSSFIDDSFNTVAGQLFKSNPNQYEFYCKPFTLTVIHAKHPYAILPVPIIQTPDNANGVRSIATLDDEDSLDFFPISAVNMKVTGGLAYGKTTKKVAYVVRIDRVEFKKNLPDTIDQLTAYLVRPFSAYDDNEEVPLPDGAADMIIQMVLGMMGKDPAKIRTNVFKPNPQQIEVTNNG